MGGPTCWWPIPSSRPNKSVLYVNQGNGNFVRATNAVTTTGGPTIGLAWGDIDNDGHLDRFVANATRQINFLFRNTGSGDFTRITNGPIVTESGRFHGGAWGDFDNDGLTITNLSGTAPILDTNAPDARSRFYRAVLP